MRFWQLLTLLGTLAAAPAALGARASAPDDYRFAPGDLIEVTVAPQHSFDRTVTIQPDGKISYPNVGQLQAAGLTVAQLVQKLRDGLRFKRRRGGEGDARTSAAGFAAPGEACASVGAPNGV